MQQSSPVLGEKLQEVVSGNEGSLGRLQGFGCELEGRPGHHSRQAQDLTGLDNGEDHRAPVLTARQHLYLSPTNDVDPVTGMTFNQNERPDRIVDDVLDPVQSSHIFRRKTAEEIGRAQFTA